jgi:thiol-disulfide isomerase/thioredoxin
MPRVGPEQAGAKRLAAADPKRDMGVLVRSSCSGDTRDVFPCGYSGLHYGMPVEGKKMLRWAALFALTLDSAIADATDSESRLKIGDPAPILRPITWIKGEPITHYDRSRIYVVEFWATWCPPCVDAMPQLTALQSKYRDKLTVVGVNALESAMGEGDENSVRAFVRKDRPRMGYTVAMDDPMKQPVFTGWMVSAGLCCLPAAFIVDRKGAIVWIGNTVASTSYPFDEALKDTLSAKPDLVRARALQESTRISSAKVLALKPALDARMKRDFETVVTEVDRVLAQHPEYAPDAFPLKLAAMLHVNEHDALAYVLSASKSEDLRKALNATDDSGYWGMVGRTIADEKDLSSNAYETASEYLQTATGGADSVGGSNGTVGPSDTTSSANHTEIWNWTALAEAQSRLGHRDRAIQAQERAIDLASRTEGTPPNLLIILKSALSEYERSN